MSPRKRERKARFAGVDALQRESKARNAAYDDRDYSTGNESSGEWRASVSSDKPTLAGSPVVKTMQWDRRAGPIPRSKHA